MSTVVRRADLLHVELPKALWSRSGRPTLGRVTRMLFASTLVLLGLAIPVPAVSLGLLAGGVAGYLLIPRITDWLIERREWKFYAAGRDNADALLTLLDQRVLFSAFAPDAWVTLQRGRVLLAKGDGRGAAQAFADTARIIRKPEYPALVSAQARALMVAGDRAGARTHLMALAERDALSPRDHLDLGVIMLGEASNAEQAREHLEAAYEGLDEHAHAGAALAVALARAGETERAKELLGRAEDEVHEEDELAMETLKKARKALRPARDAAKKKKRRKG